MGCKQSQLKDPTESNVTTPGSLREETFVARSNPPVFLRSTDRVYKLLKKAVATQTLDERTVLQVLTPEAAAFRHTHDESTPLHIATQLIEISTIARVTTLTIIQELIMAHPDGVRAQDAHGNIPLHYALAPPEETNLEALKVRAAAVRLLLKHDDHALDYLKRNNVDFGEGILCSPLYHVLHQLPDDSTPKAPPTLEYVNVIFKAISTPQGTPLVHITNASDEDRPLALLYRRFTRQFDLAEKFFSGDNSRPAVVQHRQRYKTAAGTTWKLIELLLQEQTHAGTTLYRTVHRAVQGATPPDLLRYIVETNAADLTVVDERGNLPLHYAAAACPGSAFYSKYVMDELLYKHPEAAAKPDLQGHFPLYLAVRAGKHWIGGGIKALYDAYPEALQQIPLADYPALRRALSMDAAGTAQVEDVEGDVVEDEQYDAIMLVQQRDVSASEVVTCMWAHEEDAGVQMLGCVAIRRLLQYTNAQHLALTAVPAVVNAMKAHPNEVIVQEKACQALGATASADGYCEVSFVATGAVAAIVGAMQAHVSDGTVQQESCGALAEILAHGGPDRATIVASVSGMTALLNAMAAHPENPSVQINACRALVALTAVDADVPELPKAQAEPLLMVAQSQFHECHEPVQILLERL